MRTLRGFLVRLAGFSKRVRGDREMADEFESHLQMEIEENVRSGMTPEEARRTALLKSGGLEQAKEAYRDQRGFPALGAVIRDFASALRQMRRNPGFAATVILISGVGIGGIASIYSVLWGVMLRPLPYVDSDRLVWVDAITAAGRRNSLSAMDYYDYRAQSTAFESLATRGVWQRERVVTGGVEPERVSSAKVSGNLFHTLGVRPFLGRSFMPAEEEDGGPRVVIVGRSFWERRLDGRRDLADVTLTIDGAVYQVVGVMPASFDYPPGIDLWFPMQRNGGEESGRGNNNFFIIGRLAEGATLEQAQEQLSVVAARISADNPEAKGGWGVVVTPLHEQLFGSVRPIMLLLMGATALLLLILCANLASLLLARVMSRRGELAVRLSLGASAPAITRQLLIENLVMVAIGAVLGVGLASRGIAVVKALGPGDLPRLSSIGLDAHVLWVAVAAAILTVLLSGVAPAIQGTRLNLISNTRGGGRTTEHGGHLRSRRWLVATQLALSLVLLVVAGLLLKSMARLQQVDPGLSAEGLLTVDVQIPDPETENERYFRVLERIRAIPGVVSAAGADQLPFFGGPWNGVYRADQPPSTSSDYLPATRRFVTEGFFETMGIPLLTGRGFEAADRPGSPEVTVVSASLARQLFGNESAIGQILVLPWGDGIPLEIVGIAGDVRDYGLATDFRPAFYLSVRQLSETPDSLRIAIRAAGDPAALAPSVRQVVREMEKNAALYEIGTMEQWISDTTARPRFSSFVLGVFATIATLLAAAGLFGLMSYTVARRQREIGIRLALGASAGTVLRLVLRQGVVLGLAGMAVGIPAALGVSRLLGSQLYEVGPADGFTFVTASLVLLGVAVAASAVPAVRATRINCIEALRVE